jgi:hypothetical protein
MIGGLRRRAARPGMRAPLNIDRTAFVLISRYGDDGAEVALRRSRSCANRNDERAAAEWRLVIAKVNELLARRAGPPH